MQTNKPTKMTMSQNDAQNKIKWLCGNECSNNQFVIFLFHPFSFDSIGLQLNEIIWQPKTVQRQIQTNKQTKKQTWYISFFTPYDRFYSE